MHKPASAEAGTSHCLGPSLPAATRQGAGLVAAIRAGSGRGQTEGFCLGVGCFRGVVGVVGVVGRIGVQVLESLLALGDELFEGCKKQLGGGWSSDSFYFGKGGQAVHL